MLGWASNSLTCWKNRHRLVLHIALFSWLIGRSILINLIDPDYLKVKQPGTQNCTPECLMIFRWRPTRTIQHPWWLAAPDWSRFLHRYFLDTASPLRCKFGEPRFSVNHIGYFWSSLIFLVQLHCLWCSWILLYSVSLYQPQPTCCSLGNLWIGATTNSMVTPVPQKAIHSRNHSQFEIFGVIH